MQLVELQNVYEKLVDLDAEVLAISTDNLEQAQYAVAQLGIPFPILYDVTGDVPLDYDVFNHFGDGLATGSVFVVDKAGELRWSYVYRSIQDVVPGDRIVESLEAISAA